VVKPAGAYVGKPFHYRTRRSPARQYCHILKERETFVCFFLLDMLIYCGKHVLFAIEKRPTYRESPEGGQKISAVVEIQVAFC